MKSLLFDRGLMSILAGYRLCWISGRFGGYKTLLALTIAEYFLQKGYKLITNMRCIWNDDLDSVTLDDEGKTKCVVIIDEAGLHFKETQALEDMCAYSRKMDNMFIFPGYFPPVRYAQVVTLMSVFGFTQIGIPLRIFKSQIKVKGFTDAYYFGLTNFWRYYGIYSSNSPDIGTSKIIKKFSSLTADYRRKYGEDEDEISGVGKQLQVIDVLADAGVAFQEAADDLASIPVRKSKRRGV